MSNILLQTLSNDLPSELQQLLQDESMKSTCEQYLTQLLINDDLLSTETFTTTTDNHQKTLIEEIADLDQEFYNINNKLSVITNENRDLIIDINQDLNDVHENLNHKYHQQVNQITKHFDEKFQINLSDTLLKNITRNNLLLSKIDSVLDILELPTLCKLCILQGNYHEALEISIMVKSLIIRFPKLVIFDKINQQVEIELKLMVKGLIKLLNTNLKQNQLIKIFQILSKLNLSHEPNNINGSNTLKIIYFQSRFKFLQLELSTLVPLIKFNKLTYIKRFIEVYREYIFSSLQMFQTIFKYQREDSNYDHLLMYQYIDKLIKILIDELKLHLPQIYQLEDYDISQKDGLILQIIYLCRSLSKFHINFEIIIINSLITENLLTEEEWNRNLKKVKKFRE